MRCMRFGNTSRICVYIAPLPQNGYNVLSTEDMALQDWRAKMTAIIADGLVKEALDEARTLKQIIADV